MPAKYPTQFNRRLLTRLFSKIRVSTEHFYKGVPCWDWMAARTKKGYGAVLFIKENYRGPMQPAHRVFFELFVEELPKGDDVEPDHLCRRRCCVNPAHLEAVSHKENTYRGISPWGINKRKTHCSQGHEFTEENTYIEKTPTKTMRKCVTCMRDRANKRWEMLKGLPETDERKQKLRLQHREGSKKRRERLKSLPYDHPERVAARAYFAQKGRELRQRRRHT